ncbi:MAG: 30S ribosomal protein S9 [Anaerolineales bacterium]|nr:30S ribosomal protein S9 [Anaerolineales bacterium]
MDYYEAIGRRKAATARVRLYPGGEGTIVVNDRPVEEYFGVLDALASLYGPLKATAMENRFNVSARVDGGGYVGQADAIVLAIARALVKADPDMRQALRRGGFLTRDARVKERKKPGLKRARKAPQYTKR